MRTIRTTGYIESRTFACASDAYSGPDAGYGKVCLMASVHAFSYRAARFSLQYPIELWVDHSAIAGTATQISDSGLLVRLSQPVPCGSSGKVRWHFGGCLIELDTYVASSNFLEAGLSFRFASDLERQFVQTMVKVLARGVAGRLSEVSD